MSVFRSARPWSEATTILEVGELMARWLNGELRACPTYYGKPDPETLKSPGLLSALKTANRAGFITAQSQPGSDGLGFDGQRWEQRAAVCLFCPKPQVGALTSRMRGAGVNIVTGQTGQRVTRRAGLDYIPFHPYPAWELDLLNHDTVKLIDTETVPMVLVDPIDGRNDVLWPALYRFVGQAGRR
jgi:hypothetical protein